MARLKTRLGNAIAISILFVFVSTCGSAQENTPTSSKRSMLSSIKESIGMTGSVRLGYWSVTHDLDGRRPIGSAILWGKATRNFTSSFSGFAEGWLASRGPVDQGQTRGELREAYLDLKLSRFELRAGRQIFAWGRADAINPTANLTGEDLTLLTPDTEDRKFGTSAVRTRYFLPHSVSVSSIWLPEFRPTRFPFPTLGSGMTLTRDNRRWPWDQFALRAEQAGGAIDWSISYFDGFDLLPDLSVGNDPPDSERIKVSYHRLRVIGADAATNLGHYAMRAEGAYAFTPDSGGQNPFLKEPYLFFIVGGDRTYGGELNVNLQYIFRFVARDPPAPVPSKGFAAEIAMEEAIIGSQIAQVQHGATTRIDDKWLHETLEGELGVVSYFNPRGILIRPKVTYSISDHWKAIVGGEIYRGDDRSVFGLLQSNSVGYIETRFSF